MISDLLCDYLIGETSETVNTEEFMDYLASYLGGDDMYKEIAPVLIKAFSYRDKEGKASNAKIQKALRKFYEWGDCAGSTMDFESRKIDFSVVLRDYTGKKFKDRVKYWKKYCAAWMSKV
jgi:hypothetical protein